MNDELKYPSREAVVSVLTKIGVEPNSRDLICQDLEYTSCVVAELPRYYDLYRLESTTDQEKRVLGCYFLECLNEHVSSSDVEHPLQRLAVELLYRDIHIHESELSYWMQNEHNDEEPTWPIRKFLLEMNL